MTKRASELNPDLQIDFAAWGLPAPAAAPDGTIFRLWRVPWTTKRAVQTTQIMMKAVGPETVKAAADALGAFFSALTNGYSSPWAAVAKALPNDLGGMVQALAEHFPDWWDNLVIPTLSDSVLVALGPEPDAFALPLVSTDPKAPDLIEAVFRGDSTACMGLVGIILGEALIPLGWRGKLQAVLTGRD